MTRQERRWCGAYSLVLILATTLPVWIAFRHAGSEWRFSGFLFAVEDGNSYIAKMQLGAAGAWLFRSPYTAMPQRGVIAFLPYLLLGKLAASPETHLQLVLLFLEGRDCLLAFAGVHNQGMRRGIVPTLTCQCVCLHWCVGTGPRKVWV